jgi:hypothetical protein
LPVTLAIDHWVVNLHGRVVWAIVAFFIGGVLLIGGMTVASLTARGT